VHVDVKSGRRKTVENSLADFFTCVRINFASRTENSKSICDAEKT
jgi:hypothetical protein